MTLTEFATFKAEMFAHAVAAQLASGAASQTGQGCQRDKSRRGTFHGDAMAERRAIRRAAITVKHSFLSR